MLDALRDHGHKEMLVTDVRIQEMDRETLDGIHEVAERLTRRLDAIIDPEVRDHLEDAHGVMLAALTLVCRETLDR